MQTIGERLEEARKRKGGSLRETAEATKIQSDYLQKFEGNTFDIGLPEIYVRGFLRNYAFFLKINSDKLLADLGTILGKNSRSNRRVDREIYGRMDLAEAGKSTEPKPSVPVDDSVEPAVSEERPRQRSSAVTQAPSISQDTLIKGGIVIGGAIILILIIVIGIKFIISRPFDSTKPASPSNTAVAQATQNLTLIGVQAVRVKVVQDLDEKVLFNGPLNRAKPKPLPHHAPFPDT